MAKLMRMSSIFTALFVLSTLVSQSAMDLFSTLTVLTLLGLWIARGASLQTLKQIFTATGFEAALIFWIFTVALSFALSPVEGTDWLSRLLGFKWAIVMYLLAWGLQQSGLSARVQKPAAALLAICSAYAIFVYILGRDPINPDYNLAPWSGGHRTGGFLSNAMTFAHVYGVYFCLVAGVAIHALRKPSKELIWILVALALTGVALVLSFTRGVWLALFIATLVMGFIYRPKIGAILGGLSAVTLAILIQIWPTLKERLSQFSLGGDERSWIWAGHWKIFLDHPWTGVGYTENVRLIPEYYKQIGAPDGVIVSHAHNQYLQWLAGTGVIGLVAYLVFVLCFLRLSWKTYRALPDEEVWLKGLALGTIGAQICFLVGGLTEANFEHSKMKYVMLIVWSIVIYLKSSRIRSVLGSAS